ncbi:uncharacterized protein LOC132372011 [Balaenoptera ricei]|uniref:uncharacterized protein LOC132372011 n=1 Tax=Balaenoptera ricei TaxID=2746895 RepID=UPI0028BED6BC|nr:uncharacterized protein LOC132372011 [Balaenoptera ricei]XP_059789912.1 uncharacterized protein LOC132372011 [Balaenoptera ricei]XP_059789913.1 uncharacterized protein LOC132372011 [Balaenoptera ricei]XP_059789914.1 uncharacterized protein LOC132372011 [Balaenoptera ricei]
MEQTVSLVAQGPTRYPAFNNQVLKICSVIQSLCNTPILSIKNQSSEHRFVQDLRAVNEVVVPFYLIAPNPYTVLTQVPENANWFTVLDLKDTFFCIPLHPDSQYLFAFEWTDADTHSTSQLAWTVLPQGFRDSPHLFGNALAKVCQVLNPATLMPDPPPQGSLIHSYAETIGQVYSSRPDLKDESLNKPDAKWFTYGTSFIHEGVRKASLQTTVESGSLPSYTSAQKAELIALTRALQLGKDSKYGFLVLHAHATIWKERGLPTAKGSPIKQAEILELLKAVQFPKKVAVVHCRGPQRGRTSLIRGNALADKAAKTVKNSQFYKLQLSYPTVHPSQWCHLIHLKNSTGLNVGDWKEASPGG